MVGIKFLVGIALILILNKFAVDSSIDIADFMRLPNLIVSATIFGLVIYSPELATTIQ